MKLRLCCLVCNSAINGYKPTTTKWLMILLQRSMLFFCLKVLRLEAFEGENSLKITSSCLKGNHGNPSVYIGNKGCSAKSGESCEIAEVFRFFHAFFPSCATAWSRVTLGTWNTKEHWHNLLSIIIEHTELQLSEP